MFTIASVIGDKTNNQFREELIAYVVQSTVYKALLIFFYSRVCLVCDFIFDVYNQYTFDGTHNLSTDLQTECNRFLSSQFMCSGFVHTVAVTSCILHYTLYLKTSNLN